MKRGVRSAFILLLVIILSSSLVFGIGLVYPSSYSKLLIPFEANAVHTLEYHIRTNAGKTMDYEVWAKGDLAEYVVFDPPILTDIPDGAMPSFKAILTLPEQFEPGFHRLEIYAAEGSTRGSGGGMGVRTSAFHVITVSVPYPYLYSLFSLDAMNVNEGEPVHFLAKATNLGEKDIEKASVAFSVYDSAYELVDSFSSETQFIPSQEIANFEFVWETPGIKPGEYLGSAVLSYDGETIQSETRFKIGTLKVLVKDYTKQIELDKINRFDINVSSLWNNPLENVYAELSLPDLDGMRTASVTMAPFGEDILTAFVDTTGLSLGQMEGTITVHYGDLTTELPVLVEVVEPIIEPEPEVVVVPEPIVESGKLKGMLTLSNILMFIIVILILIEVVYIFTHRRR